MYMKDKNTRITLRLSDEQANYVRGYAEILGVSPSDFLRMLVNVSMAGEKKVTEQIRSRLGESEKNPGNMTGKESNRRENETANQHDIV